LSWFCIPSHTPKKRDRPTVGRCNLALLKGTIRDIPWSARARFITILTPITLRTIYAIQVSPFAPQGHQCAKLNRVYVGSGLVTATRKLRAPLTGPRYPFASLPNGSGEEGLEAISQIQACTTASKVPVLYLLILALFGGSAPSNALTFRARGARRPPSLVSL
jgi:hypothetical protein